MMLACWTYNCGVVESVVYLPKMLVADSVTLSFVPIMALLQFSHSQVLVKVTGHLLGYSNCT